MPDTNVPAVPTPDPTVTELTPLRCARAYSVESSGKFTAVIDTKTDEPARDYKINVDARQTRGETLRFVVFVPVLYNGKVAFVDGVQILNVVAGTSTYQVRVYDRWRGLKVVLVSSKNVLELGEENFNVTLNATGSKHVAKAASACLDGALEWSK